MHIIIIPILFTRFQRQLVTRRSDYYLRLDWPGVWDLFTYFEPLLLFIFIPFNIDMPFGDRKIAYWITLTGIFQNGDFYQTLQCTKGIFCTNFFSSCERFPQCKSCWYEKYYIPLGNMNFPMIKDQIQTENKWYIFWAKVDFRRD